MNSFSRPAFVSVAAQFGEGFDSVDVVGWSNSVSCLISSYCSLGLPHFVLRSIPDTFLMGGRQTERESMCDRVSQTKPSSPPRLTHLSQILQNSLGIEKD